jgi:hypothetical protein
VPALVLLLAVGSLALEACGSSGSSTKTATGATSANSAVATTRNGVPKNIDPRLTDPGSPGAAVLDLWRYLQMGAVPVAMLSIDQKAQASVGEAILAGAMASVQGDLKSTKAYVTGTEQTPAGTLVRVAATRPDGGLSTDVFLLRQRGGKWKVVYDTLLTDAIRIHAESLADNRSVPAGKDPSARAVAAGLAATDRYRASAITGG